MGTSSVTKCWASERHRVGYFHKEGVGLKVSYGLQFIRTFSPAICRRVLKLIVYDNQELLGGICVHFHEEKEFGQNLQEDGDMEEAEATRCAQFEDESPQQKS